MRFSSNFGDLGILPHISNVHKSVSKVLDREALGHIKSHHLTKGDPKCSSSQSSSYKVSPPSFAAAEPRMGDHESDGLEYQDDEEEEDEDDEPVHDQIGRASCRERV